MGKVGSKPIQSPGDDYPKDVKPELDTSLNARIVRLTQSITELSQADEFYMDNLITFNATSGDEVMQGNLLKLSDNIRERFKGNEANDLALQIRRTAMGMSSDEMINSKHTSLKELGCGTAKEAVDFIIEHELTSANLWAYKEYDDESLQKLIAALEKLSRECPYVKKLTIYSEALPISTFIMMFQKLKNLEYLDIGGCRNLRDPEFLDALKKVPLLEFLNLSGCEIPEYELVRVLKDLPHLKTLCLSGYKPIDDKVAIPEEWLKFCSKLEHLDLSRSKVSEVMILKIVENSENLKHLDLSGCEISGEKLAKTLGTRLNLEYLSLSNCVDIKDIYAEEIGKLLNLQSLKLYGCSKISSEKVVEMLTNLVRLKSLELGMCRIISADAFAAPLKNLTQLEYLSLNGCRGINSPNPIFSEALGHCTKLRSLNLLSCQIPLKSVIEALRKLTNLQLLHLNKELAVEVQKEFPMLKIRNG